MTLSSLSLNLTCDLLSGIYCEDISKFGEAQTFLHKTASETSRRTFYLGCIPRFITNLSAVSTAIKLVELACQIHSLSVRFIPSLLVGNSLCLAGLSLSLTAHKLHASYDVQKACLSFNQTLTKIARVASLASSFALLYMGLPYAGLVTTLQLGLTASSFLSSYSWFNANHTYLTGSEQKHIRTENLILQAQIKGLQFMNNNRPSEISITELWRVHSEQWKTEYQTRIQEMTRQAYHFLKQPQWATYLSDTQNYEDGIDILQTSSATRPLANITQLIEIVGGISYLENGVISTPMEYHHIAWSYDKINELSGFVHLYTLRELVKLLTPEERQLLLQSLIADKRSIEEPEAQGLDRFNCSIVNIERRQLFNYIYNTTCALAFQLMKSDLIQKNNINALGQAYSEAITADLNNH